MEGNENQILLTPGPVPMPQSVCDALAEPMIHHRTPQFTEILQSTLVDLKVFFKTAQPVMIHTATGSGAMESALVNTLCKGDTVLAIVSGKFGERWAEMAKVYGLNVEIYNVEWGETFSVDDVVEKLNSLPSCRAVLTQYCETSTATMHPIQELAEKLRHHSTLLMVDAITAIGACPLKMDAWGIDVVVAGSQKAFMMPTGLSFIALSEKAWAAQAKSDLPKYYFDLSRERKANEKGQTYFSSAVSHIKALRAALKHLQEMGLDQQIARCQEMAKISQEALKIIGLQIFSASPSPSVTAFEVPAGVNGGLLRKTIEEKYGVTLMGGQDQLKGKIIRLGHLGYIRNEDLLRGLLTIAKALPELGFAISDEDFSKYQEFCINNLK